MAFKKKESKTIFTLFMVAVLMHVSLISAVNFDCEGKAFYCLNSTHFMICVDLGDGISKTVDDFIIPCPPPTVCMETNNFECEYIKTTTTQLPTSKQISSENQNGKEIVTKDEIPFELITEDAEITTVIPFWYKSNVEKSEQYYNTPSTLTESSQYSDTQVTEKQMEILTTKISKESSVIPEFTDKKPAFQIFEKSEINIDLVKNSSLHSVVSDTIDHLKEKDYTTTPKYEDYFDTVSTTTLSENTEATTVTDSYTEMTNLDQVGNDFYSTSQVSQNSITEPKNLIIDFGDTVTSTIFAITPSNDKSFDISTTTLAINTSSNAYSELTYITEDPSGVSEQSITYNFNPNYNETEESNIIFTTISKYDDTGSKTSQIEPITSTVSPERSLKIPLSTDSRKEFLFTLSTSAEPITDSFNLLTDPNKIVETNKILTTTTTNYGEDFNTASTISQPENTNSFTMSSSGSSKILYSVPLAKDTREDSSLTSVATAELITESFNLPNDANRIVKTNNIFTKTSNYDEEFNTVTTMIPSESSKKPYRVKATDPRKVQTLLTASATADTITENINLPSNTIGIVDMNNIFTTAFNYDENLNTTSSTSPPEHSISLMSSSDSSKKSYGVPITKESRKVFSFTSLATSEPITERFTLPSDPNGIETNNVFTTASFYDEDFNSASKKPHSVQMTTDTGKVFPFTSDAIPEPITESFNLHTDPNGIVETINIFTTAFNYNEDFITSNRRSPPVRIIPSMRSLDSTKKSYEVPVGLVEELITESKNLPTDSIGVETNNIITTNSYREHFDTTTPTNSPQSYGSFNRNSSDSLQKDLSLGDDPGKVFSHTLDTSEALITESLNTNSEGTFETINIATTISSKEGFFDITSTAMPARDTASNDIMISSSPSIDSKEVFSTTLDIPKKPISMIYTSLSGSKGIAKINDHMTTTITESYNYSTDVRKYNNVVSPTQGNNALFAEYFNTVSSTVAEVNPSELIGVSNTPTETPYLTVTSDEGNISPIVDVLRDLISETNNLLTNSRKKPNNIITTNSNIEEFSTGYDNTQDTGPITVSYDLPMNPMGIRETNNIVMSNKISDELNLTDGSTRPAKDKSKSGIGGAITRKNDPTSNGVSKRIPMDGIDYVTNIPWSITGQHKDILSKIDDLDKNIIYPNGIKVDFHENVFTDTPLESKTILKDTTTEVSVTEELHKETVKFATEYISTSVNVHTPQPDMELGIYDDVVLSTPSVVNTVFKDNNYVTTSQQEFVHSPFSSIVMEKVHMQLGKNNLRTSPIALDVSETTPDTLNIQETMQIVQNKTRDEQDINFPSIKKSTKVLQNATGNKNATSTIYPYKTTPKYNSIAKTYTSISQWNEVPNITQANTNRETNNNYMMTTNKSEPYKPIEMLTINQVAYSTTEISEKGKINYNLSTNTPEGGRYESISEPKNLTTGQVNVRSISTLKSDLNTEKNDTQENNLLTRLFNLRATDVTSSQSFKYDNSSGKPIEQNILSTITPDGDYQAKENKYKSTYSYIIHNSMSPKIKEEVSFIRDVTATPHEIKLNLHSTQIEPVKLSQEPQNDAVLEVKVSEGNVAVPKLHLRHNASAGLIQAALDSRANNIKPNQSTVNPLSQNISQNRKYEINNYAAQYENLHKTTFYNSALNITHTTLAPVNRSYDFNCFNRFRGKYAHIHNCTKFYICIGRFYPIIGQCPKNTVFSDILKQCTRNLSHCVRRNQFKCTSAGRFSDILVRDVYYICVRNGNKYIRFKLRCQKGYVLNKTSVTCIEDTPLLVSSSKYDSTLKGSTSSSSADSRSVNNQEKSTKQQFVCVEEGTFSDPHDCRVYYRCTITNKSEFRRRTKKCDSDEVFHKRKKKCVDAESYECE